MNSMLFDIHGNVSYSPCDDYEEEVEFDEFDEDAHKYYDL